MAIRYAVANEHIHTHYIGSQSVVSHTQTHTHHSLWSVFQRQPKVFIPIWMWIYILARCAISLSANFLFMYPKESSIRTSSIQRIIFAFRFRSAYLAPSNVRMEQLFVTISTANRETFGRSQTKKMWSPSWCNVMQTEERPHTRIKY